VQRRNNPGIHVIDLDKIEKADILKKSHLFKDAVPIILETTQNSLIGEMIDELYVMDSILIIGDFSGAKSVFIFNREGKFSHKIGRTGQGPGEYVSIDDFCVDTVSKIIYILDRASNRIHRYEIYSGKHIKSVKLPENLSGDYSAHAYIECKNSALYVSVSCYNFADDGEGFLLHRIDPDSGKSVESWFDFREYNKGKINIMKRPFMHTSQEGLNIPNELLVIPYDSIFMIRPYFAIISQTDNIEMIFFPQRNNQKLTDMYFSEIKKIMRHANKI
jgi:hypothetical protein